MSHSDPLELFQELLADAERREPSDPSAVALATVDGEGRVGVRMVLLRGFDERGFVFYTNLDSRKGHDLRDNPHAALCFHWKSTERQVRIEGLIEIVGDQEADEYFASRTRESQVGAWASKQSEPLSSRFELEKAVAKYALRFAVGKVPRPPFWSGYRLKPDVIEFWKKRPFRLHDRARYTRTSDGWRTEKLYP
jgi:pyridoxamine 5'-phosphate oxidase